MTEKGESMTEKGESMTEKGEPLTPKTEPMTARDKGTISKGLLATDRPRGAELLLHGVRSDNTYRLQGSI
eukprot:1031267-Prorocentrum_minimum.AAC.1